MIFRDYCAHFFSSQLVEFSFALDAGRLEADAIDARTLRMTNHNPKLITLRYGLLSRSLRCWAAATMFLISGTCIPAEAAPLGLAPLAEMARACAPHVAVSTLAAIARTESDLDPLALRDSTAQIDGAPAKLEDAVTIAARLIAAGHSVDLGLMQINSANLPVLGLTVTQAFDPCRSLAAGATILSRDYAGGTSHAQQQAALHEALSRYNTGDPARGFANGYVGRVDAANAIIVPALDVAPHAKPLDRPAAVAVAAATPARPSWEVFPSRAGGDAAVMTFSTTEDSR